MTPIEPFELSALLDGELDASRAEEVRWAMARDPALRRAFERFSALDADWRASAEGVMIEPAVTFTPRSHRRPIVLASILVLVLLLIRLSLKAQPPLIGSAFDAVLLVALIGWGLRRMVEATDVDRLQACVPRFVVN